MRSSIMVNNVHGDVGTVDGNIYGKVRGNVYGNVGGDVEGTIGGKHWKNEFFEGAMKGYDAGFNEGFNEGICYALSFLFDQQPK